MARRFARTAVRTGALAASFLASCAEPPALDGVVLDAWGRPIEGARVLIEGRFEQVRSESDGSFQMPRPEGKVRLMAGKDGYIRNAVEVVVPEGDAPIPVAEIRLFPDPPTPGFYAVTGKEYDHLQARPVATVGTELKSFTGLRDAGEIVLPSGAPIRFVFSSTLRSTDLARLDLQLHRLEFVGETTIPGLLGEEEVAVNLFVAREAAAFDMKGLLSRDDYVIATREGLAPGTYAFHTNGLLMAQTFSALDKLPKEMRVAFPFEVR